MTETAQTGKGKHTAGPWRVLPPTSERLSRATVASEGGATIYDAPLTGETEANARLIAAAPALLEALRAMVSRYGVGIDDSNELPQARAAIRLVEGSDG